VGADEVRLKRPVVPGDCLTLEASILTSKRGIYKFQCRASVGDELVGEAIISPTAHREAETAKAHRG